MKPQDPLKEYQGRGMTLITITAPPTGPIAVRQGDLIIPGTQIGFGGFTTLLGHKSTDSSSDQSGGDRDVYLLGMTNSGLQLARVGVNDLNLFSKYSFWEPDKLDFTDTPPKPDLIDNKQIYIPGSFSCGSIFYSPYFLTFIMVYFNKMVDSTFYIRYLDLTNPLKKDSTWLPGGKNGKGIEAEDAEALIRYTWSPQQTLYSSPPGKGGFNYAGSVHSEFFNRRYFARSLYPGNTPADQRFNDWYGSSIVPESDGVDGKNLLLSWTSQKVGGMDTGIYEIQLAVVEFDAIPKDPDNLNPTATSSGKPDQGPDAKATHTQSTHDAVKSIFHKVEAGSANVLSAMREHAIWWCMIMLLLVTRLFV